MLRPAKHGVGVAAPASLSEAVVLLFPNMGTLNLNIAICGNK